jgi:hypothetical protein
VLLRLLLQEVDWLGKATLLVLPQTVFQAPLLSSLRQEQEVVEQQALVQALVLEVVSLVPEQA